MRCDETIEITRKKNLPVAMDDDGERVTAVVRPATCKWMQIVRGVIE